MNHRINDIHESALRLVIQMLKPRKLFFQTFQNLHSTSGLPVIHLCSFVIMLCYVMLFYLGFFVIS